MTAKFSNRPDAAINKTKHKSIKQISQANETFFSLQDVGKL